MVWGYCKFNILNDLSLHMKSVIALKTTINQTFIALAQSELLDTR